MGLDERHPLTARHRIQGIEEMHRLVVSTLSALGEADLLPEAQHLHARILMQPPETVMDRAVVASNEFRCTFKPAVELLLFELWHIARTPVLSIDTRRERIRWAMQMSGF